MATSNVTLIVNAAQAVNPLRQVTAETKKLEGATRDVNGRLRNQKDGFVKVGRAASGASKGVNKLKGVIGGLLGAFTAIQTAKFVFFKTAELETQTRSLKVLTGSLGSAKNIIGELQRFGAVTPFTGSELIETAKRLKAFGFETEQVVDVTKRLADIAGATGADLSGIATAFGQIQAKGRLQGEELLQLQERGVDLAGVLREEYDLTGEQFQAALSKGQISAEAVNFAVEKLTEAGGKYAEGAISQSDTLSGKFSTLVDNVDQLARTIGQVLSPVIKGVFNQAIQTLEVLNRMLAAGRGGAFNREIGGIGATITFGATSQAIDDAEKFLTQISSQKNKAGIQQNIQALTQLSNALKRIPATDPNADRIVPLQGRIMQLQNQNLAALSNLPSQALTEIVKPDLGLTNGGGTTSTSSAAAKPDMSQKLFDLNSRLLGQEGEITELEKLSLEFQIAKQKVLENDLKPREEAIELLRAEVGFEEQLLDFRQKGIDAENKQKQKAEKERQKMEAAEQKRRESDPGFQMQKQLDELLKLENQVAAGATAIGSAFSNAFVSVVTGSKSAKEALADMMSAVAEHFMDMAAQIIAKQLAMILYGTITKALGITADVGGVGSMTGAFDSGVGGIFPTNPAFTYAEGGYVSSPTNALIGEGGEPEYVIPESKMRTAMSRYSRGSRGGSVIPESGAAEAMGEAGGTAVAAAIDVRYTVERINSIDYVTADQFQAGMQQAAQQGAKQGEQQTLKRLQMSGSTRKRIGI